MLSGINAFNASFLDNVNQTQARIAHDQQQISSGIRVTQASDDPAAVSSILDYQEEIGRVTQVATNLNSAATTASAADNALQSASSLLDQLVAVGAQGSNTSVTTATQAGLANQVQLIAQRLVGLANTASQGVYVFGGDSSTTQPYTFTGTGPKGVVQNSTAGSTGVLTDAGGSHAASGMTAQQIFDLQTAPPTMPATSGIGNVFQAVYDLGAALALPNNQAAIAAATLEVKNAVTQVGQATTSNGNLENWIKSAQSDAADRLVNLRQGLSSVRDTDIAMVAVQLTTDNTALQASLAAHATLSNKSLFSYLG